MFRIPLILGVFLALTCAGIAAAADGPASQSSPTVPQRPDGRLVPDSADIPTTAPAIRPDDRAERFTPGASLDDTFVSGRPDGRLTPDSADLGDAITPVVISVDTSNTTPFDWLAALIGGLAVGGIALATGGLLVIRNHRPASVS